MNGAFRLSCLGSSQYALLNSERVHTIGLARGHDFMTLVNELFSVRGGLGGAAGGVRGAVMMIWNGLDLKWMFGIWNGCLVFGMDVYIWTGCLVFGMVVYGLERMFSILSLKFCSDSGHNSCL